MTSRGSIEAWDALSRCHVSVTRQLQRDVDLRGLSRREFEVLATLDGADRGGLRLRDLNSHVLLTQSSLSRMLERLENKGLVTRRQDSQDLRGVRVALTEAGGRLYKQISEDNDQKVADVMSTALDSQEIRVLTRLSERIHQYALSLSR
ncbi:MarR family transcriptional regulator [Kocuria tytonicola]|uniref:MarR family transcriptional regulator n=1 Tax=Kocuria tytonicola TaxID=2055946 RepID=A0A3L9M5R9_9MICC|nr:MarR family transcriptional regulator [Kocuria tytonicola]RLY94692.1 MarR family transcriptional regulator [Kocuria tytonicola]RLZ04003.1 MarR family transcriptional regulator [Kocuria tytonicola]